MRTERKSVSRIILMWVFQILLVIIGLFTLLTSTGDENEQRGGALL